MIQFSSFEGVELVPVDVRCVCSLLQLLQYTVYSIQYTHTTRADLFDSIVLYS